MTDDHTQAFIHEAEEGITELNNALLTLEGDPENGEAMDSIFRTAHTLKGNAAAMGYTDASGLAHALEDLLDEVRDDEIAVTPELMDLLFAGVDQLELMFGEIAEHGESHTDPTETEEKVREAIEAGGDRGDDVEVVDADDD
ncbi:Hpt domain-containing protein, partial [Halobium palmae]